MEYVNLGSVLHEKQKYLLDIARILGIDINAIRHDEATSTCFEKARILGWEPYRIVKAVYLHKDRKMYGFVFPELGTKDKHSRISSGKLKELFGLNSLDNSLIPEGMESGTCTPFVFDDAFIKGDIPLKEIYFHEHLGLNSQIVDISIGGKGDKAHKTSLHLNYRDIFRILENQFGEDRIIEYDLF